MLHLVRSLSDSFFGLLSQDPVRPGIPHTSRIGDNKDIFVFRNESNEAQAITCVSYQNSIPQSEAELFQISNSPDIAVFYTIWSYKPGAGRTLILDAVRHINTNKSTISRFVTLSPKTEMAKRFHLNNGAMIFRSNLETVNYEYIV